jgi:hypothetical protein
MMILKNTIFYFAIIVIIAVIIIYISYNSRSIIIANGFIFSNLTNSIDLNNLHKYSSLLPFNNEVLKNIGLEKMKNQGCFSPCNPTFALNKFGDLVVNVRFLNYMHCKLNKKNRLKTINIIAKINITNKIWKKIQEGEIVSNEEYYICGIEDVRLFNNNGELCYTSNVPMYNGNINIEIGYIDDFFEKYNSGMVQIKKKKWSNQNKKEKNWVFCKDTSNNLKIIYKWRPLIVCEYQVNSKNNEYKYVLKNTHTIPTNPFFDSLRGTTNGVTIGNEIWFICHNREYYHCIVVLNATTFEPIKYSKYFKFNNSNIEFCLGFIYFQEINSFLIGYGIQDKNTNYVMIDKTVFEKIMNLHLL